MSVVNAQIEKLAKKAKLDEDQVVEILAEEQLLGKHYKNLVNFNANFTPKAAKIIKRISKVLKVSDSAVVSSMLKRFLIAQGKK